MNSKITFVERPLPTKSSIQSQKNCNIKTSSVTKNTAINGPMNALITSLSSFLNINYTLLCEASLQFLFLSIGLLWTSMIKQTKIQFLPAEMAFVSSPDIILTKNAIVQKIKSFLEEIQIKQFDILKKYSSKLPAEVLKISPKISRGENYKGLPWLVLDNPSYFQHNNIFAVRTMFWWGNFFSITLHLSGNNKDDLLKKIFAVNSFSKLAIKFPIDSLAAVEDKLLRNYELLVKCCC